jgi:hypothetical protein
MPRRTRTRAPCYADLIQKSHAPPGFRTLLDGLCRSPSCHSRIIGTVNTPSSPFAKGGLVLG